MTPRGLLRLLLLLLSGMAEASVDLGDPGANDVKRTPTTYALHPTLYELTPRLLKDRLDLGLSRAAEATANLRVPSAIDGTRNGFGLEFPLDGLNVNKRETFGGASSVSSRHLIKRWMWPWQTRDQRRPTRASSSTPETTYDLQHLAKLQELEKQLEEALAWDVLKDLESHEGLVADGDQKGVVVCKSAPYNICFVKEGTGPPATPDDKAHLRPVRFLRIY